MPFNNLELLETGAISCCGSFFEDGFYNRHRDTGNAQDLWNNQWFQDLRTSTLDGSFRHCTDRCPIYAKIKSGTIPEFRPLAIAADTRTHLAVSTGQMTLPVGPRWMALSDDRSCNLCCRSCRLSHINDAREVHDFKYERAVALLERYGKDLERLAFSSTGEPFFSRYYLRLMREYLCREKLPKAAIRIGTNGVLLTPEMWNSLKCKDMVESLYVSVDAATEKTYEIVRGKNWSRLMENLEFIKSLRVSESIKYFQIRMVIQSVNWREMEDFAKLAFSFQAHPAFQIVYPGAGLSDQDIIYRKEHPDYEEFITALRALDAKYPWTEAYYRQLL